MSSEAGAIQNEQITEDGYTLSGPALKLSTFKVGTEVRGKKIGELFLKAAFRYATLNRLESIFVHGDMEQHAFLFDLLDDFGFEYVGVHPGSEGRDGVYLKAHPIEAPKEDRMLAFEYMRKYFPHYRSDRNIPKYIVPIKPQYHDILFPDYESPEAQQMLLFKATNATGNAIKLAYLSYAPIKGIVAGSIVLFYRSGDQQAVTSLGVVEDYQSLTDAAHIAQLVSRRTVYSMQEIESIATRPTKVLLFRLVKHLHSPVTHKALLAHGIVKGNLQSITTINHEAFEKINALAG